MTDTRALLSFRDRVFLTAFTTTTIGGIAYGSMWSAGWNGAAFAGLTIFASLWAGALYFVWTAR